MKNRFKKTNNPSTLIIDWRHLEEIIATIGSRPAETGGIVGGKGESGSIDCFHFDQNSRNSVATYSPGHHYLNDLLKHDWNRRGIRLHGFLHSHPSGNDQPSYGDEVYAERILDAISDLACLWLPIINTIPDTGQFRLTPWVARRQRHGISIERGQVQVINCPAYSTLKVANQLVLEAITPEQPMNKIVIGKQRVRHHAIAPVAETVISNTFDRVREAYDLDLMHNSRIIAVGAGGAAEWLEQLARAGLGQFVLIDPDIVSETNLATQQTYRRDIGRPKVECIAERLRDINPEIAIVALQKKLDDLTDDDIQRLATGTISGRNAVRTVLCGLTDNFHAQARVNRLALQFGLPSLCAGIYRQGRAAEVTYTFPGITPACHRCILSSRYAAHERPDFNGEVTSHGTPIFSTARLNATKGFVLLAMLHHGSDHPRWGNMLERLGKRNLIQIRMDPDLAENLGIRIFDKVPKMEYADQFFFDETVWLPQNQECPQTGYPEPCPDCGGTGNLSDALGTFADTRQGSTKIGSPTTMEKVS